MDQVYDYNEFSNKVDWCCRGRHGVIWNVPKEQYWETSRQITYFFGGKPNKGQWWKDNKNGTYSVEFTHMTKVYPPPKQPWEWCGKSILFPESAEIDQLNEDMAKLFKVGMMVKFNFKGQEELIGMIVNKSKRAVIVVPGRESKYYIPFGHLEIV